MHSLYIYTLATVLHVLPLILVLLPIQAIPKLGSNSYRYMVVNAFFSPLNFPLFDSLSISAIHSYSYSCWNPLCTLFSARVP